MLTGHNQPMRWELLFEDLEAQWAEQERQDIQGEAVEQARYWSGEVTVLDRAAMACGREVVVFLRGGSSVRGLLREVGGDWLQVRPPAAGACLVPLAAVTAVQGLSAGADTVQSGLRRFDMRYFLRALARDRLPVQIVDVDGHGRAGTVTRVGKDHCDLAEHPLDVPPRRSEIRSVVTLPLASISLVRER